MGTEISRRALLTGATAAPLLVAMASPAGADAPAPGRGVGVHRELRDLEESHAGRIGAFALDTANGAKVAYRADERFPLLSTFKVLAAAAVLRKARRSDPGLLDRLIRWDESDLVPHSPVTEKHVDTGLTVALLCGAAITRSDNTAANLLLEQIGGPPGLTRFARSIGDPITRLDRWEVELNDWYPGEKRDTTTPRRMGRDLCALAIGRGLVREDRERLVGWMRANTTGDRRIRAGLPDDWIIGDKTGTSGTYGAANDIAVARPPSCAPLIMAIYTNRWDADAEPDDSVIAATAAILARALGRL